MTRALASRKHVQTLSVLLALALPWGAAASPAGPAAPDDEPPQALDPVYRFDGEPIKESTRIALQAGWRYTPNAAFGASAAKAGFALAHPSPGGPALTAVFGYRPSAVTELAIEVGLASERFALTNSKPLNLVQVPVGLVFRWSPVWTERLLPYAGAGYGYLLNFFDGGPTGSVESNGKGPTLLLGASWTVGERLALVAEGRATFATVEVPGLGRLETGGVMLMFGGQFGFPPERQRLR